jgi:alkanesulfonate monooxygenase SsuD/methylene tetrahydromethanopterin reductase-like flavin-dependent oxidoreductase (luciferase family)
VRLGVSLNSTYVVDDVRAGARAMVERARAAYAAGLDSLFVGDHHAVPVPYYQNVAILGRLLADWNGRTAGALFLLPLWNPVLVAEQVGTLAAIHDGRFVMQCALGGGSDQFAAMGADLAARPARFEASLDIVRRLLRGEEVDARGPFTVGGARANPHPAEPVEVWIGASAPRAIERAARLGDAFLAGPECTPAQARAVLELHRAACERAGRPARAVIRRDVHVGASVDDARRVAGPVLDAGYRGFDPSAVVVGSAESVAADLAGLADAGYEEVLVRHLSPDQAEVLASFERLATVRDLIRSA